MSSSSHVSVVHVLYLVKSLYFEQISLDRQGWRLASCLHGPVRRLEVDLCDRRGERACALAGGFPPPPAPASQHEGDRKSTRLNSSHVAISYAVFCLKKKNERATEELQICVR